MEINETVAGEVVWLVHGRRCKIGDLQRLCHSEREEFADDEFDGILLLSCLFGFLADSTCQSGFLKSTKNKLPNQLRDLSFWQ